MTSENICNDYIKQLKLFYDYRDDWRSRPGRDEEKWRWRWLRKSLTWGRMPKVYGRMPSESVTI